MATLKQIMDRFRKPTHQAEQAKKAVDQAEQVKKMADAMAQLMDEQGWSMDEFMASGITPHFYRHRPCPGDNIMDIIKLIPNEAVAPDEIILGGGIQPIIGKHVGPVAICSECAKEMEWATYRDAVMFVDQAAGLKREWVYVCDECLKHISQEVYVRRE